MVIFNGMVDGILKKVENSAEKEKITDICEDMKDFVEDAESYSENFKVLSNEDREETIKKLHGKYEYIRLKIQDEIENETLKNKLITFLSSTLANAPAISLKSAEEQKVVCPGCDCGIF